MEKMKNDKTSGPDDIPVEVWKTMGRGGPELLADLFNSVISAGAVPKVWMTSTTVPVWKGKGNVAEYTDYLPIRLLCHAMKIFERVIVQCLRDIIMI